jgi:hypothetical protein
MSSFICEHCGKELIDTPGGDYVTECEHYPKEKRKPYSEPWNTWVKQLEEAMLAKYIQQHEKDTIQKAMEMMKDKKPLSLREMSEEIERLKERIAKLERLVSPYSFQYDKEYGPLPSDDGPMP